MPLVQCLVQAIMQLRPRFAVAARRMQAGGGHAGFSAGCLAAWLPGVMWVPAWV